MTSRTTMNNVRFRSLIVLPALFLAASLAGCSSGGGGGSSVLRVVSFTPDGTDGVVFRDEALVFTFSAAIDSTSVSSIGLQIIRNTEVVQGRIEVEGRQILWTPVVQPGDRNDYFPDNRPPINGLGFDADTRYTVKMAAGGNSSIKTRTGRPLGVEFQATFLTSDEFLPEDPPDSPRVILDETSPRFSPPPIVDGDPFSPHPDDWPILDPSELTIRVRLSERIRPNSVDPFSTVTVTNVTEVPGQQPGGVGEIAMMDTRLSDTAEEIIIRNVVSLGDWPSSTDPYEFRVDITEGLTDLVGNALEAPVFFHFRTADKPGENNYAVHTEEFDDQDFMEPIVTSARWGDGVLEGAEVSRRVDDFIPNRQQDFLLPHPLVQRGQPFTPNGCRFQMKWDSDHIPALAGESITGMAWAPISQFAFQSTYSEVTVKLGHFITGDRQNLNPVFDFNFGETPVTVFRGDYIVSFNLGIEWVDWPPFSRDFELEQDRPLVFEYDMPEGGDTFQLFRNTSPNATPVHRILANGGSERSILPREATQYNQRFYFISKSSFAQSLPIDTQLGAADFDGFLVHFDRERPGTKIRPLWGASFDGEEPESFSEDINAADGATHMVFQVDLAANPVTVRVPRVFSLSFAYVVPFGG